MERAEGPAREASFPTLLGAAQRTYIAMVRSTLAEAGFADLPRTGYWIVGFVARGGSGLQELASGLTVSKQAASRLVDLLVQRDYCKRIPDPADRRRMLLTLTERGRVAAREIRSATVAVNEDLARRVDGGDIAATRATLLTLIAMGRESRLAAVAPHAPNR